jgi:hypothetical protein
MSRIKSDELIKRLQEISVALLPDFPGKAPNADSIARARSLIIALIGDAKSYQDAAFNVSVDADGRIVSVSPAGSAP